MTYEGRLERALTATLQDLIDNATGCGCCDNDQSHAELIKRTMSRTPVELWPGVTELPKLFTTSMLYIPIWRSLVERRITW